MSWLTQGRKEHGWFGDDTAPPTSPDSSDKVAASSGVGGVKQRIETVIGTVVAHLPAADRRNAAVQPGGEATGKLARAMLVWSAAQTRGGAAALAKTLPPDTSDAIIAKLHDATTATIDARDKAGLIAAGAAMASAVRAIGLSRLPRFAATAASAAEDALAASATLRATLAGAETGGELTIEAGPLATAAGITAGALTGFVASRLGASITATPTPPPQKMVLSTPLPPPLPPPAGTTTADPVSSSGAALPSAPKTATVLPGAPINPPRGATILEAKPSAEEAAKRAAIIASKGLPAAGTANPYIPPKTWTSSKPLPRGPRGGYMDEQGREWYHAKGHVKIDVSHWDVRLTNGRHLNVMNNGVVHHGAGKSRK